MRSSKLLTSLLLLAPAAISCSDSGSNKPDAFIVVADARPDAPPLPAGCDFAELRDDSNDSFTNTGSFEDTGLMFAGNSTICGKANSNHFEAPTMAGDLGLVDLDSYKFTLPADATMFITMSGAGLENLKGNFRIYSSEDGTTFDVNEAFGEMHGGHTATRVRLPMGVYEFDAIFLKDAAITADVSYKIKIVTEDLASRCTALTTGGYTEMSDGAGFGNDMVKWKYGTGGGIALTQTTADVPENTQITAAPTMSYRITGNSANITSAEPTADDYKDHDTFEFKTGPTTNQITIRLATPTTTADIDIAMGPKPAIGVTDVNFMDIANNIGVGPTEMVLTTAVEPDTTYWLWVAGYKEYPTGQTTTAPSTAATYDATMCAKTFTP